MRYGIIGCIIVGVLLGRCSAKKEIEPVTEETMTTEVVPDEAANVPSPDAGYEEIQTQPQGTVVEETIPTPETVETPVEEVSLAEKLKDLELSRIHFGFDQFLLNAEAKEKILENVRRFKAVVDDTNQAYIRIIGHADQRGTEEYNLALGLKRAAQIKQYMVNLGVSEDLIKTFSMGEEEPLVSGDTEQAYAQNRRGEFVVEIKK